MVLVADIKYHFRHCKFTIVLGYTVLQLYHVSYDQSENGKSYIIGCYGEPLGLSIVFLLHLLLPCSQKGTLKYACPPPLSWILTMIRQTITVRGELCCRCCR